MKTTCGFMLLFLSAFILFSSCKTNAPSTPEDTSATEIPTIEVTPTYTPTPYQGESVVFLSDRDGGTDIYIMNTDGSNLSRLTNDSYFESLPSISPNGHKIVFESNKSGSMEIFVMDRDGQNQVNLSNSGVNNMGPVWSPDSGKVVYMGTDGPGGDDEIFIVNYDGTGKVKLTDNAAGDYNPRWHPDGTKIVFSSQRDGDNQIYTMNIDGSSQTKMITASGGFRPVYSPDGSKIAFFNNSGLAVINSDGTGELSLASGTDIFGMITPSWKCESNTILFTKYNYSTFGYEIFTISSSGTNETNLSNNTAGDYNAVWSPDCTKIYFQTDRNGNYEIYSMNADGSNQVNITNNSARDDLPFCR